MVTYGNVENALKSHECRYPDACSLIVCIMLQILKLNQSLKVWQQLIYINS